MATFKFPTLDRDRVPLLVDGGQDRVPRIKRPEGIELSVVLQKLLTAAEEAELAMRTRTVIYRDNIELALRAGVGQSHSTHIKRWSAPCSGTFFAVQEEGEHVLAASAPVRETRDYGRFQPSIYQSLDRKNWFPAGIAEKHIHDVIALIEPQQDDLICETGAGLDQARIEALGKLAAERGAHFICHDVVPLAMKEGRTRMPHIPYIALPPFPAFLGKVLNSVTGKKTLMMKNTLTSMNSDEINDWLDIIESCKAGSVVITQSVGPNLDVLVPEGKKAVEQTCQSFALRSAREHTQDKQSYKIVAMLISERAKQVAYTSILEILIQNLADRAAKKGLFINKKVETSATVDQDDQEAISRFMTDKGIAFMSEFREGLFNEIIFTPTAILYRKVDDIPLGTLRICSQQIHIVFERKRTSTNAINACGRNEMNIPIPAFVALKKWIPDITLDELEFDPVSAARIKNECTYAGLGTAFDFLGDVIHLPEFKQYRDTQFERDMYTSFGVTVDS